MFAKIETVIGLCAVFVVHYYELVIQEETWLYHRVVNEVVSVCPLN